jgi:hypothetical protein
LEKRDRRGGLSYRAAGRRTGLLACLSLRAKPRAAGNAIHTVAGSGTAALSAITCIWNGCPSPNDQFAPELLVTARIGMNPTPVPVPSPVNAQFTVPETPFNTSQYAVYGDSVIPDAVNVLLPSTVVSASGAVRAAIDVPGPEKVFVYKSSSALPFDVMILGALRSSVAEIRV